MCPRIAADRPSRSCVRRVDCSMATSVEFDDLHQPTLKNIAKLMKTCEIRQSKIQEGNLGLFNASGEVIPADTVFRILSHGPLYVGNPVSMQRMCACNMCFAASAVHWLCTRINNHGLGGNCQILQLSTWHAIMWRVA